MNRWVETIVHEIERRSDDLIALCSRLIQFPSENPPGDSREISRFIIDYLAQYGIETQIYEASPTMWNLLATIGRQPGKHLIYCGHTDVVPAGERSGWAVPPFSGAVQDGYIHGRGASDMKGGLAGILFATALLRHLNVPLSGKLSLMIVPDEETGGRLGVPWVLERGLITGTAAVIAEPTSPYNPTIGQKGSCWFEVVVHGTPAHGSLSPMKGNSAILKAARAILALQKLWEMKPDIPPEMEHILALSKAHMNELHGGDVGAVLDHVSINVGVVQGGTKVNVVPDTCVLQVDTRVPFGLAYTDVLEEAERLLADAGVEAEIRPYGFQGNANWTPPSEEIVQRLVEAIMSVSGKEAYGVLQWASSDARHFRAHGIPVLQYGPAEIAGIHSYNERVSVAQVIQCAKVYALTALTYLTA